MNVLSETAPPTVEVRPTLSAEAEFTAFVSASQGRLLRMAELICGDPERGADLLQGVLAKTYLRWSSVRQENPVGYVRAALVNARADWWRRLSSRERPIAAVPDRSRPDPTAEVISRETVLRALRVLTHRERSVVVLRFYEDLSEAEIARVLRVAPGTVKSACSRALAKLRISPDLMGDDR